MKFKGGAIIIGSLLWDNEPKRIKWRKLYLTSDKFKADKEVVMAAVSNHGHALKYAYYELQNDPEIIKLL